jgi:hypothetical protein
MSEIVDLLRAAGLQLVWIAPEFLDPRTSHMLQVNGLFLRQGGL